MNVLLTTPSGKVGSEVAKLLRQQGVRYRLGVRDVAKAQAAFPGSEVERFDYGDEATFQAALAGMDAVYLASPAGADAAPEKRLVDVARSAGVKRIVKLSAMGVENTDVALRQVEKHIEASGLEWTHLRPNWFMQNYATQQAQAIRSGVLAEPAGEGKTAFIDARDIAEVAVKALTGSGHNGRAYELTGPESLSRAQVAAKLSQVLGREVKYIPLSDEQFREAVRAFMPPGNIELMCNLYAGIRAGWTARSTDTVRQVLGREPRTFTQFALDYCSAWK